MNKTREAEVEIGKELEVLEENYRGPSKNYILRVLKFVNKKIKPPLE
jgi:hypothetical protein